MKKSLAYPPRTSGKITGAFIASIVVILVLLGGALSMLLTERRDRIETARLRQEIISLDQETSSLDTFLGEDLEASSTNQTTH